MIKNDWAISCIVVFRFYGNIYRIIFHGQETSRGLIAIQFWEHCHRVICCHCSR